MSPEKLEKFWSNVKKGEGDKCWIWTGKKSSFGYGRFSMFYTSYYAHRISFLLSGGEFTVEKPYALHSCHTPLCVAPHHLRAGDQYDNMKDMEEAGRARKATGDRHWAKTHPEKICKGERNGRAKLTVAQVEEIRQRYAAGGIYQYQLAAEYGVTQGLITKIICKKNWA